MTPDTGLYLVPKIKLLAGLQGYYSGASPSGSMVHVSLWQGDTPIRWGDDRERG